MTLTNRFAKSVRQQESEARNDTRRNYPHGHKGKEKPMSKAMTMQELSALLEHIRQDHSFCRQKNGRHVKYVDPNIDTRTWECFAITFRGLGDPVVLHTQNEYRDVNDSLYERCMDWLDEEPK